MVYKIYIKSKKNQLKNSLPSYHYVLPIIHVNSTMHTLSVYTVHTTAIETNVVKFCISKNF